MENSNQGNFAPQAQQAVPAGMDLMTAVKTCFSKYADFNGRATRSEYWYFFLFNFIVGIVLGWIPFLGWLVSLALLVPSLAVAWRRLHDIGKSGAFYLFILIPLVGWIFVLIWLCKETQPGDNQYGPQPLA